MEKNRHDYLFICLAIFDFFLFAFIQFINAIAALGPDSPVDWFKSNTADISDKYYTEITPAGWTFIVWAVIYVWQLVLILFILLTLCLKNKNGEPLYLYPPTLSTAFLGVYGVNLAINATWLFMFDREEMVAALVFILLIPITLYICLADNLWRCSKYGPVLYRFHRVYLICNRIFIQNGLAVYATWTTIASLINLSIVLVYNVRLSQQTSCIISLSLLAIVILNLSLAENTYLEQQFRYIFTPWLVIIWALCGVLYEQWDLSKPTCIFSLALVCLASVCFLFKYTFCYCRFQKKPINHSQFSEEIPIEGMNGNRSKGQGFN